MYKAVAILLFFILALPQERDKVALEDGFASIIIAGSGKDAGLDLSLYVKDRGRIYRMSGGSYHVDSIRGDSFAVMKGHSLVPLVRPAFPAESVMTIFTNPAASRDIMLTLTHHMFGFRTERHLFNLSDFTASCMAEGCRVYVGVEELGKSSITATVFLVNKDRGYCHVMKTMFPPEILETASGEVTADIHTYIPIDNISELFAK